MLRRIALSLGLLVSCGDDGDDSGSGSGSGSASVTAASAGTTEGTSGSMTLGDSSGNVGDACAMAGGMCQCAGTCGTQTQPALDASCPQPPDEAGACSMECCVEASGDTNDVDPGTTGAGVGGPIELYRGPVQGGNLPGWDPDAPRPLLMLGGLAGMWVTTLARIGDDGALSDNVTTELVVWGWEQAPPLLYDGPVAGGALPGWSADGPIPVVMLGRTEAESSWVATLASIGPDGALGDNLADRIVVWGWPDGTPGAPAQAYDGPVGGMLPGWDPDQPRPLVMLARFADADTWQSTLATIAGDGTLGGNVADELRVWDW